jgi:acyl-coenzyme A synthetase/AMP-(fatty) acid ligase
VQIEGRTLHVETLGALDREGAPRGSAAPAHGREPASILFTSGSSGPPKGVCQSHENLIWGAGAVAASVGLDPEDRILSAIPWAFDYGWGQLLSTFLRGAAQLIPETRNPFALCTAIERLRPTVLPSVPSLAASLIRGVSPIRDTDLGSIQLITNTGSKIPDGLFAEMLELFPEAEISLNYGLTETYRSASLPAALARSHSGSVGRAVGGAALTVLREDGTEAAPGEVGEIVHRGCGVFLGYWGEPGRTAETRRPDPLWRHDGVESPMAVFTGDLGWRDEEGLLYVKGRRDRQIKSMGVRVSPDEVEELICANGLVAEAAVLSRPHEMMGEMVVAVIAPRRQGEDPVAALKAQARASMSPFMRPMEWNLVEALPRTPSGKVDYPALRRLYGEAPA